MLTLTANTSALSLTLDTVSLEQEDMLTVSGTLAGHQGRTAVEGGFGEAKPGSDLPGRAGLSGTRGLAGPAALVTAEPAVDLAAQLAAWLAA